MVSAVKRETDTNIELGSRILTQPSGREGFSLLHHTLVHITRSKRRLPDGDALHRRMIAAAQRRGKLFSEEMSYYTNDSLDGAVSTNEWYIASPTHFVSLQDDVNIGPSFEHILIYECFLGSFAIIFIHFHLQLCTSRNFAMHWNQRAFKVIDWFNTLKYNSSEYPPVYPARGLF